MGGEADKPAAQAEGKLRKFPPDSTIFKVKVEVIS